MTFNALKLVVSDLKSSAFILYHNSIAISDFGPVTTSNVDDLISLTVHYTIVMEIRCRHLIPALNMLTTRALYVTTHPIAISFLGIDALIT